MASSTSALADVTGTGVCMPVWLIRVPVTVSTSELVAAPCAMAGAAPKHKSALAAAQPLSRRRSFDALSVSVSPR